MRLHAEARRARERYRLYRAKVYDSGAESLRRLRDVERASEAARLACAGRSTRRPERAHHVRTG